MKIAICDDQKTDRDNLKQAIYRLGEEVNVEFSIIEYNNPEGLYADCDARNDLQVIFFDVYMGDVLGTDAAKKMREMGYKGSIIFCTSSEDHALEGFRVQADGYLVKPYTYEQFKEAISRLMTTIIHEQKSVHFTSDRIDYDIPISEIIMIETSNKGCIVHTTKESLFTWTKLKAFTEEIDSDSFYQIGRYYLVNMDMIESVRDKCIILTTKDEITLPQRDVLRIKQDINDYFWKKTRQLR